MIKRSRSVRSTAKQVEPDMNLGNVCRIYFHTGKRGRGNWMGCDVGPDYWIHTQCVGLKVPVEILEMKKFKYLCPKPIRRPSIDVVNMNALK